MALRLREDFLQAHSLSDPDCLILDIGLPWMTGLDAKASS
jgi:FixJ family two-component response regulator